MNTLACRVVIGYLATTVMLAACTTATTQKSPEQKPALNAPPRYPPESVVLREEGTTLIKLLVLEDGRPSSLQVDQSSGYPRLDNAALETVSTWRFKPAHREGKPVEAWLLVPVTFKLK
jgi:TonB family protein